MSRISLDTYNHDILYEIVSVAGAKNLTKLLDSTFLQSNPNIQQAINKDITKKPIYKYDNATTLFESEDYSIDSNRRTTDFNTIAKVQAFDDYCVENSIAIELEFAYLMRAILDWIEMEKLLKCLKASKFVKRQLKIGLTVSDYTLDLTKLPSLIGPIKERFIGLSINSSPTGSSKGAIDLEYLRDIEVLQLNLCEINGSFSQYHHLRELDYMPPGTQNSIDLQMLPPTLKRLHLYSCERIKCVADKSSELPSLEVIAVTYKGTELPSCVKGILRLMTSNGTSSIEYEGSGYTSADEEFLEILYEEADKKGFTLDSLSLSTSFEFKLQLLPSRRLVQIGVPYGHWHPSELPSTLKEIYLQNMELSSGMIFEYFPSSLVKLELIGCAGIDWSDSVLDFSKFSNLKTLALKICNIGNYIDSFTFPHSLDEMNLCHNGINSIDAVKFPKNLKKLALVLEGVYEICKAPFPRSLKELDLTGNELKNVDLVFNKFGELLQIDLLDLTRNDLVLSKCKLPDTVRFLAVDCIQDEAFHFGGNLRVLNLSWGEFQKQHEITLGSSLTSLDLSWCKLKHFSMKLPESLEKIDLSSNGLSEVPAQLCKLRNLKAINISNNKIKSVNLNFTSSALEVFKMNHNKIKELQLTFPEAVTNLKSVDLSANRLRRFSMAMIGHNGKTLHNNLYELVLLENYQLSEGDISTLLAQLRKSTHLVWTNSVHYKSSYSYVANQLSNKYLTQRKKRSRNTHDSYLDTDSESGKGRVEEASARKNGRTDRNEQEERDALMKARDGENPDQWSDRKFQQWLFGWNAFTDGYESKL
ncbi:hypothetical protein I9W82_002792 [Candida metapsilosis]|uniref:Uncharacterized protein n=1 Tax=Candida metapsilosis TaxID=273372 RepID=A0A8H7ZGF3_9ASCO|nr:hypothetical protein I9W82_002792 [Candida metapsilosis]